MILQGIRTSIAKKPYISVIFQPGGGGPDHLSPCLDPRRHRHLKNLFVLMR